MADVVKHESQFELLCQTYRCSRSLGSRAASHNRLLALQLDASRERHDLLFAERPAT